MNASHSTHDQLGLDLGLDLDRAYAAGDDPLAGLDPVPGVTPPQVVMSYGLGVDSTAILLRWLHEPSSRDFDLKDLVVVTAMTGDEWAKTGSDVEQHILPLLRAHGVRYVQAARARRHVTTAGSGLVVLDDSTAPDALHLDGAYKLSDEMREAGTLPQSGGMRACSVHSKGDVLDPVIARITAGQPFRHIIGFESEEQRRATKDALYNTSTRTGEYPLLEWGWDRAKCESYITGKTGVAWSKSACSYCLAGETEVVTRAGVRQISEISGQTVELLVPTLGSRGGPSARGKFQAVQVEEVGVQPLYRVELNRGRSRKTVFATLGHRWLVAQTPGAQWSSAETFERTTGTLRVGDRLRSLQAAVPVKERRMSFAVAQGFVFGDGARGQGRRPASLPIYNNDKDHALLPFFATCESRPLKDGGTFIYGLPRAWKQLPDIDESRSFLLSWLAGYFAADGTVSKAGVATIYSAAEEHIRFVRDAAAVCGVGYTPIRRKDRPDFKGRPASLWQMNLSVRDLPEWFFVIPTHRDRVAHLIGQPQPRGHWRVVSVQPTDRVEPVYCAEVPEAGSFALADDLLTGNCPFSLGSKAGRNIAIQRYVENPEQAISTLTMEHLALALNPKQGLIAGKRLADELVEAGHGHLIDLLQRRLDTETYAVYEVRRILRPKADDPTKLANASRSVATVFTGTRAAASADLRAQAAARGLTTSTGPDGIARVHIRERGETLPALEHYLVAAPAGALDKQVAKFETWWTELTDTTTPELPAA